MAIYDNITQVVGNTPLVRINRINEGGAEILAKLEFYNPSSTVKDRIGIAMVDAAERSGELKPGGSIVEATSGNTGIALAMVGAARGYKVILTMPDSMSKERRALLRAYGAELVLTPAAEGMRGAVAKAEQIGVEQGAVQVRQFANEANPEIHRKTTAQEIWRDTNGEVAALVAGVGTGGTITGIGQVLKELNPDIKVFAVEPAASPILNGGSPAGHPIQGIGANFVPEILDTTVYDEVLDATADDAVKWSRLAASKEGILGGISSGAALWGANEISKRPEFAGKKIVVIIPSFGERYLSTILFKDLVDLDN
jgi:cysteine synthase A